MQLLPPLPGSGQPDWAQRPSTRVRLTRPPTTLSLGVAPATPPAQPTGFWVDLAAMAISARLRLGA